VQSIEGGGWGGRPAEDGESGTVSVCQGDVRNASIEGIELKCPVLIESRALRPDSCGAGKFRGGLGIDLRVRNLVEGKWNFEHARREHCPPWGIWGGTAGEAGGYLLRRPGEKTFIVMTGAHVPVPIGATAIVRTGGGGGWGDPLDRDPALVQNDVAEGLISTAAARRCYGVALRRKMLLDENATRALRLRLRSARKASLKTGTRAVRKAGKRAAKSRRKVRQKITGR
jgi:N-methylhydantoinase B